MAVEVNGSGALRLFVYGKLMATGEGDTEKAFKLLIIYHELANLEYLPSKNLLKAIRACGGLQALTANLKSVLF